MSWLQKLYETYEANMGRCQPAVSGMPLLPVSHGLQQAHIEIVIDNSGKFIRAAVLDSAVETVIPITEKSAGRTTNEAPHPLADKIQYIAKDYCEPFGGKKKGYFVSYIAQLESWCTTNPHPKAQAVLNYVRKGRVVADLVRAKVLRTDSSGTLLSSNPDTSASSGIFKVLPKDSSKKEAGKPVQDQGNVFVRWRVETPEIPLSGTWEDPSLIQSWADFDAGCGSDTGLCLVSGETKKALAKTHPKRLRHGGDGARLISSNDNEGYTFRGRFVLPEEAAAVASDVTQKAHSALRWLIARQAYRNGDQTIVAWAVSGKSIPDPLATFDDLLRDEPEQANAERSNRETNSLESEAGDVGQAISKRLSTKIAGYQAELGPTEDIVVMGLDSATPGRMAITFYRELTASEFLERLVHWHETNAWFQNFPKDLTFVGAPAPKDIAAAAYGRRLDDKLSRATVERLLPCIIDKRPVPRDLVEAAVRRTGSRVGMEWWEWEKTLGIACSLFKGLHTARGYSMTLESRRQTRDYLYGRLLAVADRLERHALYLSGENRDTAAARLMQRFSDRPFSTWRNIEKGLQPYKSRLQVKDPAFLFWINGILDEVHNLFTAEDYTNDQPLSGEYLLGYHCQRRALYAKPEDNGDAQSDESSY
jgi:CRISPR-associated protein Csd1